MRALAAALLLGLAACSAVEPAPVPARDPITFSDLLQRPRQAPDARIAYGAAPEQFGELWLPANPTGRPLPVVVLIHGGCWQASLPGTELMDYLAADLRARGYAVWNLEYRRIGHAGGGYPGTFQDVARGVDHLRAFARERNLDLDRTVFVGHSAGGHLATWAAGRRRLPKDSPLRVGVPLTPRAVVSLAGINDLKAFRAKGPTRCGGPATIDDLVDAGRTGADLFGDTSPARLAPIGIRQWIYSGELDPIVPPIFGTEFAAGEPGRARAITLAGAGHFELIDPTSAAWRVIVRSIETTLR